MFQISEVLHLAHVHATQKFNVSAWERADLFTLVRVRNLLGPT